MQSDQPFQSGPPGGGNSDDESPTTRVRPPTPGQTPTPGAPYGQQPDGFPPQPSQPGFGAPPQFPPAQPAPPPGYILPQPGGMPGPQFPPSQPGFGSGTQPGYGPPSQPPGPQFPPPQPGYGPPPGFGSAPQGGFPPPQPGYPGTPFPPPQPGYPGGPMMPPPKKGRGGLIAIIAIVLLVVIAGGIVAAIALTGKKPATSTGPGASTPTPSIPAGFKKFTGSTFSIAYPSDWKPVGDAQGTSGEEFTSDSGQVFQVTISAGARSGQEDLFNTGFCSVVGNASDATPAAVTIGGQQWHQLDCGEKSSLHAVVESLVYKGTLFSLSYLSPITTFDSDKTQFYTPMEQSFAFLT